MGVSELPFCRVVRLHVEAIKARKALMVLVLQRVDHGGLVGEGFLKK
jgi:hypothetical protein